MSRRGENIYKRKDGRWEGRYIESRDITGKAKYHSVYAATYKEVKEKIKNERKQKGKQKSNIYVCDWICQYLSQRQSKIKITTYNVYERYINNHIYPFFNSYLLQQLNNELLQKFVNSICDLAPSTIKGIFGFLCEALKEANKYNLIEKIWEDVDLPKIKKRDVYVFSREEQLMIEKELKIEENPNEIGILLCLYTGIRIGEVCGLKWSDINFFGKSLTINRTVQRININGKNVLKELTPKSSSSCRKIPLPSLLFDILCQLKERSECKYILNTDSKIMDPRTYQYLYKRVLKRCNVKYSNFHTLRHTFSVRALECGFDIKTLSEILGHSNASTTIKFYSHSLEEHKRNSMERLWEEREKNN